MLLRGQRCWRITDDRFMLRRMGVKLKHTDLTEEMNLGEFACGDGVNRCDRGERIDQPAGAKCLGCAVWGMA